MTYKAEAIPRAEWLQLIPCGRCGHIHVLMNDGAGKPLAEMRMGPPEANALAQSVQVAIGLMDRAQAAHEAKQTATAPEVGKCH